jgi:hypothetical protein
MLLSFSLLVKIAIAAQRTAVPIHSPICKIGSKLSRYTAVAVTIVDEDFVYVLIKLKKPSTPKGVVRKWNIMFRGFE